VSRTPEQKRQQAAAARARYAAGGETSRQVSRERVDKVRQARIPIINAIKVESGCVDCGYRDHPGALQFDHRDPSTKSFQISKGLTRSWAAILTEIAKCDVRCANCHVIRSMRDGHLGRPRIGDERIAEVIDLPLDFPKEA
jgi:hypothetical protein